MVKGEAEVSFETEAVLSPSPSEVSEEWMIQEDTEQVMLLPCNRKHVLAKSQMDHRVRQMDQQDKVLKLRVFRKICDLGSQ